MTFELFIAMRYLRAKRKQAFISVISLVSIMGVALGVAALIIVLGVMNGFSQNLRDKILGINAHIVVGNYTGGISDYSDMSQELNSLPGVLGSAPFIYTEVMLSSPGGVKGVVLRGIEPQKASEVLTLDQEMILGRVGDLENEKDFPGIIIGRELSSTIGVTVGDTVNILSPSGGRTAAGFSPQISVFEVRGIFSTGMYEYDSSFGYTTISAAQSILGFREDMVTGMEVRVHDVDRAHAVSVTIDELLGGYPYYVRNWMEMNQNLFAALQLEKIAMGYPGHDCPGGLIQHSHRPGHAGYGKNQGHRHLDVHGRNQIPDPKDFYLAGNAYRSRGHCPGFCFRARNQPPAQGISVYPASG